MDRGVDPKMDCREDRARLKAAGFDGITVGRDLGLWDLSSGSKHNEVS